MVARIASSKVRSDRASSAEDKLGSKLRRRFNTLNRTGEIEWRGRSSLPVGVRLVRIPLMREKHPDGFAFTALVPAGALRPGVKPDLSKAKSFFVERSGGFAGITQYAGPFAINKADERCDQGPTPFFARFLEGQKRCGSNPPLMTKKFPSDSEDGGAVTEKYPSDNEDGGSGGGGVTTAKYPSDSEDGGSGSGGVTTAKYPSDNEDGGGDPITQPDRPGDAVTLKYPSDNEDGGSGGGFVTEKFPSDNEDGGSDPVRPGRPGDMVTLKFPSDNEDGGGGSFVTEKFPSDNEDGGVR